jgi:hypothetical protein
VKESKASQGDCAINEPQRKAAGCQESQTTSSRRNPFLEVLVPAYTTKKARKRKKKQVHSLARSVSDMRGGCMDL